MGQRTAAAAECVCLQLVMLELLQMHPLRPLCHLTLAAEVTTSLLLMMCLRGMGEGQASPC